MSARGFFIRSALCAVLAWPALVVGQVGVVKAPTADAKPPGPPRDVRNEPAAAGDLSAAAAFVKEGNQLLSDGKFKSALEKYDAAAKADPSRPEVAYNRGLALFRLGRYDEAEAAFQDAIKPSHPELEANAKFNLGRAAQASGMSKMASPEKAKEAVNDFSNAVGFYNDALQLTPDDAAAQNNRAAAERALRYLQMRAQNQNEQQQQSGNSTSQPSSQPGQQQSPSSQPQQASASQPSKEQQQGEKSEENEQQQSNAQQEKDKDEKENKDNEQKNPSESKDRDKSSKEGQDNSDSAQEKKDNQDKTPEADEKEQRPMTREEAERYLQKARDLQRKRREQQRQAELRRRGRIPVDKDW